MWKYKISWARIEKKIYCYQDIIFKKLIFLTQNVTDHECVKYPEITTKLRVYNFLKYTPPFLSSTCLQFKCLPTKERIEQILNWHSVCALQKNSFTNQNSNLDKKQFYCERIYSLQRKVSFTYWKLGLCKNQWKWKFIWKVEKYAEITWMVVNFTGKYKGKLLIGCLIIHRGELKWFFID